MKLKEARELSGYNPEDIKKVFGISEEELDRLENMEEDTPYKELLIRAILCNSRQDADRVCLYVENKGVLSPDKPKKPSLTLRFSSVGEALRAFPQFQRYVPGKGKNDRFYELSIWLCDDAWQPKTVVRRIVKEF